MLFHRSSVVVVLGCTFLTASCAEDSATAPEQERARGGLAITVSTKNLTLDDVDAIHFSVVADGSPCSGPVLAERVVSFAPGKDAFADTLFVLPPGSYKACAHPLQAGVAAPRCAEASALVDVSAEQTSDIQLLSQCTGDPTGALAVLVELNQPPQVAGLELDPGKTLSVCETLSIDADVADPDGDDITFMWEQVGGAAGSHLEASDNRLRFWGPAGAYELKLTVTDGHGASSSLQFPVQIVAATCVVPAEVQTLFTNNCAPCHITGASGGLKLDPASVAYTSLVGHAVGAAACSARTLVVPGHADQSYLVAKLRGEPGICGVQMPRGRPPLVEADIQTIEAWINALPY